MAIKAQSSPKVFDSDCILDLSRGFRNGSEILKALESSAVAMSLQTRRVVTGESLETPRGRGKLPAVMYSAGEIMQTYHGQRYTLPELVGMAGRLGLSHLPPQSALYACLDDITAPNGRVLVVASEPLIYKTNGRMLKKLLGLKRENGSLRLLTFDASPDNLFSAGTYWLWRPMD